MQEDVGLQAITDGEFRRTYFHIDFLKQLDGVQSDDPKIVIKADGSEELAPPVMRVVGKVRHGRDIQRADFEFLKATTKRTPKVTIPSPTMLHFRGGRAGISQKDYPDLEQFYDDVARAYGDELRAPDLLGVQRLHRDVEHRGRESARLERRRRPRHRQRLMPQLVARHQENCPLASHKGHST